MSSLRTRLFIILVAATSLIWLFAIGWISVGTKHEVENVLDKRLEEAARMVSSLVTNNNVASPSEDSDSPHILAVPNYERQLDCQIWSLDGRLVARTSGAPSTSLGDSKAGFSERLIDGVTWRVFTTVVPGKGIRVLVGDRQRIREQLVADVIKGLLAPTVLIIPLLGFLIWASLNRGLRPLRSMAFELQGRNADDMSPIEPGRVPRKFAPSSRRSMDCSRKLRAPASTNVRLPPLPRTNFVRRLPACGRKLKSRLPRRIPPLVTRRSAKSSSP
jgi:two-component system, OmpR family, sensor histidine kinase QseC